MKSLTELYQIQLHGVLSCYDRMIITGTLPGACYVGGMTNFLNFRDIKIFDYSKVFADPWRERIRQCPHALAEAQNVSIEHVNKPHIRKEDLIAKVIAQRGKHPGLVHILSAMETCSAYRPWHDKKPLRTMCAYSILREKIIKRAMYAAVVAPTIVHLLDQHYINLRNELDKTFETLDLAT